MEEKHWIITSKGKVKERIFEYIDDVEEFLDKITPSHTLKGGVFNKR